MHTNDVDSSLRKAFLPVLLLLVLSAACFRILPLYNEVILPDSVRFQGVDAFYHVRLTHYVVDHYPSTMDIDPLRKHPAGQVVDVYPAFDLLAASISHIVGLGSPSDRTVDLVLAFLPPLYGSMTVLLIGLAGRYIGGSAGGLAAAALAAFLPGGTVTQTVIGFADHHALETLLLAGCWYILARYWDRSRSLQSDIAPWLILGGVIALYIHTWEGSPILPVTIGVSLMLWILYADPAADRLKRAIFRCILVLLSSWTVLLTIGFTKPMVTVSSLLLLLLPLLPILSFSLRRILPDMNRGLRTLVWMFIIGGSCYLTYVLMPERVQNTLLTNIGRFFPSTTARTVGELRPLIEEPRLLWQFFGPALPWALVGGLALFYGRGRTYTIGLVIALGIVLIPASLLQLRFASAGSLALALLSGAAFSLVQTGPEQTVTLRFMKNRIAQWSFVLIWIITVPVWSIDEALEKSLLDRGPSQDWTDAMEWLRTNTPDPLDPDSANTVRSNGVLNWWDSGYYLTTLAERPPVSNPTQSGARTAAMFFLDTAGTRTIETLRGKGIKYIAADARLAQLPDNTLGAVGIYPVLHIWTQRPLAAYVRTVHFPMPDGSYEPRTVYTPEYFKGLHVRLLLFGVGAIEPSQGNMWIIRTRMDLLPSGETIESVESAQSVPSYEAAVQFLSARRDRSWQLVSQSPFDTCVPLPELRGVEEVFSSETKVISEPSLPEPISAVRLFRISDVQ